MIVQSDRLLALSTVVLCEMAGAVDARRLGEQVGHLAVDEMASVEDALSLVLDLA